PLPAPQRQALEVALFLASASGTPPSQLAVSLAVRGVLAFVAAHGPVLVAVDDVHWFDGPTADALDFALRRLGSEPIGVLATARGESHEERPWIVEALPEDRLRRVAVPPLGADELDQLLRTRLQLAVPRSHLARLHRECGGNPLYALEIGRALQRQGGTWDPAGPLPVPDSLGALLRARLESVPADV